MSSISVKRVAVVTGSNKGIGFATVRGLCKKFDGDVFLTARNVEAGEAAVKALNGEGLHPKFHQLDITDSGSVERLKSFLQSNYGGLDILFNNVGISNAGSTAPVDVQAEVTMATNFWSTLSTCKILFPLLRPHARVVNVSSIGSDYATRACSPQIQSRLTSPDLTMADVENLMTEVVQSAKDGTYNDKGWPLDILYGPYCVSKIGTTLMTFVQQKDFRNDPREDIVLNACCPGYTATALNNYEGTKTVAEGAADLLYAAFLPPNTPPSIGKIISEKKAEDWPYGTKIVLPK